MNKIGPAPGITVASAWRRSRLLVRLAQERGPVNLLDEAMALETATLTWPIRSRDDAIAKLRAVALSFVEGQRSDGADAVALEAAIAWLGEPSERERAPPAAN